MSDLEKQVYEVCLKAAIELGPQNFKKLSWFSNNNKRFRFTLLKN